MCTSGSGRHSNRNRFLTIRQVAEELNHSERSVWRRIESKELPTYQFGASTRVRREDLDAYIDKNRR